MGEIPAASGNGRKIVPWRNAHTTFPLGHYSPSKKQGRSKNPFLQLVGFVLLHWVGSSCRIELTDHHQVRISSPPAATAFCRSRLLFRTIPLSLTARVRFLEKSQQRTPLPSSPPKEGKHGTAGKEGGINFDSRKRNDCLRRRSQHQTWGGAS